MSEPKKILTDPPKNLKEAIDWVLRVSGMDSVQKDDSEGQEAIKGLAKELIKLLNSDPKDVADGVLRVMGKSITALADKLGKETEQVSAWKDHVQRKPFKVLEAYLRTFNENLENVRDYGSRVSEEQLGKLKRWLIGEPSGAITQLADGLKTFIGWQSGQVGSNGIGKQSSYKSPYNKSEATWNALKNKDTDKVNCALIFLGIAPMLFYGLTYLYWWCEGQDGWSGQNFTNGSSTLSKFMTTIGFENKYLNDSQSTGQKVAGVLKTAFAEFHTEYEAAKKAPQTINSQNSNDPSYAYFIDHYERRARALSPSNSDSPLKSCFAIASPLFTPNPPHRVQSTSPDTPSFLGYSGLGALAGGAYGFNLGGLGSFVSTLLACPLSASVDLSLRCPSNLKDAIDWILRATGKDRGGSGSDNSQKLAKAITEMPDFNEAIKAAVEKLKDSGSDDVSKALGNLKEPRTLDEIIKKLAEGLGIFIGYNKNNNGIIEANRGIGRSNDPSERLRDAIWGFLADMIGTFDRYKKHTNLVLEGVNSDALKGQIGNGLKTFETAVGKLDRLSEKSNPQKIDKVVQQLKEVNALKQNKSVLAQLAFAFKTYLGNLFKQVEEDSNIKSAQLKQQDDVKNLVTQVKNTITNVVNQLTSTSAQSPLDLRKDGNGIGKHIDDAWKTLTSLSVTMSAIPRTSPVANVLCIAVFNATKGLLTQLMLCYQSSYNGVTTDVLTSSTSTEAAKCAKIFLACLPLIFSNLQHLYWKCKHDNSKGGWKEMHLNGSGNEGSALKHFMDLMTFSSVRLNGTMTGERVESVMRTSFAEFSTAASGQSYADFLKKFKTTGIEAWKTNHNTAKNDHYLSGLYLCSTSYFRHQHQMKAAQARPPSSIREMLYWLMCLTATPQFGDLLGHIDNVVGTNFHVAVSWSSRNDDTLTADKVTSYILSTCYASPSVLNIIQGSVPPNESNDKPWLHELYSNDAFRFMYPSSGAALFYALSDYTYALQFQLTFLYKQCEDMYSNTCGWQFCTFGKTVNQSTASQIVETHICSVGCTTDGHKGSDHGKDYCKHDGCGENTKASPLQAFLTDKLKGFSRSHPSNPSSHIGSCSGVLCHVPMGFDGKLCAEASSGLNIAYALGSFCGGFNTPLRQLSEKLGCLTKRTPRTLGDLFGFTWHLKGQLFG
ncbi:variant erythrocyte surface antigen-1 family protein [Babesia caballi]|uniref:Variant erythrocyte surface antigen-1 family protein n=1 Tax=Babesia caballi TaxID=5871 RepID=A0AAV4LMA3_BABCB|nr:variant erythrocyte surface antigen-1 family protein [Babesia caballi]